MSLDFRIHHIIPESLLENQFEDGIKNLFPDGHTNPFSAQGKWNKIPLFVDPNTASNLAGIDPFSNFGDNAHVIGQGNNHPGLFSFLESRLTALGLTDPRLNPNSSQFDNALRDMVVADLQRLQNFAEHVAKTNVPPLDTPSGAGAFTDAFNQYKLNYPTTDTQLLAEIDQRIASINAGTLGDISNTEFTREIVIGFHNKLLNRSDLTQPERDEYQRRLDLIKDTNDISDARAKDLGIKAAISIGQREGRIDGSSNPVLNYDPNNPTSYFTPLDANGIKALQNYTDNSIIGTAQDRMTAILNKNNTTLAEIQNGGAHNLSDGALERILDLKSRVESLSDKFKGFLGNDSGAVDLRYLDDSVTTMIDSVADVANRLSSASSLNDFRSTMNSVTRAFEDAERNLGAELSKLKYGPLLEKAGIVGELYDLIQAGQTAGEMWANGDREGAVIHYIGALSEAIIVNALSTYAGMLAITAGAPPVAALLAVVGVGIGLTLALDLLKQSFNPPPMDPLVIDLDGDGVELISLTNSTAFFDLDGDGFAEATGWVSPDDALLAIDSNGNGSIDDISELFGSDTQTGYQELAQLDTNGDGVVDSNDAAFSSLRLWRDLDGDGQSDAGELMDLATAGIQSISTTPVADQRTIAGHEVIESSTVTWTDGSVTESAEVLFELSQVESTYTIPSDFSYDSGVFTLPYLSGSGDLPDLWVEMSNQPQLYTDVEGMLTSLRNGGMSSFSSQFDQFLVDWAGVGGARWLEDVPDAYVLYAYNANQYGPTEGAILGTYTGTSTPDYSWINDIEGYIFIDGRISDAANAFSISQDPAIQNWASTNNFYVPGDGFLRGDLDAGIGIGIGRQVQGGFGAGTVISQNGSRIVRVDGSYVLANDDGSSGSPSMPASHVAFVETVMGQEWRNAQNFISHDDIIVYDPSPAELAQLQDGYDSVKNYFATRFLAQSAWSILAEEGDTADLGALAAFENIYLNPYEDKIAGDIKAFVVDYINYARANNLETDAQSVKFLSMFKDEAPYVPVLIAENFPNIDRAIIEAEFGVSFSAVGTSGADTITATAPGIVLGEDGNDTITTSSSGNMVSGGAGNDTLNGLEGNDSYVYSLGDGNDVISDYNPLGGKDVIYFTDIASTDFTASRSGNDLILTFSNGETITIDEQLDYYYTKRIERFEFADGVSFDEAQMRQRMLEDMKAAGHAQGTQLASTYYHTQGDGSYQITEFSVFGNTDRMIFTDTLESDLSVSRAGDNLILTLNNGEVIQINKQLDQWQEHVVEMFEFADGFELTEREMRERMLSEMKSTGAVVGTAMSENYTHSLGDGSYTVSDYSLFGDSDRLIFSDINSDEFTLSQAGEDLIITLSNGETIRLIGQHDQYGEFGIESFDFNDGITMTASDMRQRMIADAKATGAVVGTADNEIYYHALGDGSYTITDYDLQASNDRMVLTDVGVGEVTATQSGDNLVFTFSNGETVSVINQFLYQDATYGIESFEFADGTILDEQGILAKIASDSGYVGQNWSQISTLLQLDVQDTGQYGNNWNGLSDGDGQLLVGFTSTGTEDLRLTFKGYDIDTSGEVVVLLNGAQVGYLGTGVNNGLSNHVLDFDAADLNAGNNIVTFQNVNPSYIWGIDDLELKVYNYADIHWSQISTLLQPGVQDTGQFGNNWNGLSEGDGRLDVGFTSTGSDMQLSLTGFDIDFADEIAIRLNGVHAGYLSVGVNEGTSSHVFDFAAADIQDGNNIITFQNSNPTWKWGIDDLMIV